LAENPALAEESAIKTVENELRNITGISFDNNLNFSIEIDELAIATPHAKEIKGFTFYPVERLDEKNV